MTAESAVAAGEGPSVRGAEARPAAVTGNRVTTEKPTYPTKTEQNVYIPMSDGAVLAADIFRPDAPEGSKFPCLFEMTPYRKEMRAAEGADYFPSRGFVYVEADARGTGGSPGKYDTIFSVQEQLDGYDAIEWLGTKYPWCNGKVGLFGGSYSGINQYLIAASPKGNPPHLVTIAPQRALTDLYRDVVYVGGIVTGSFGVIWSSGTSGYNAAGADPRTNPDPAIAAQALVDHAQAVPMLATFLNSPYADARLLDSYGNEAGLYADSSSIFRMDRLRLPILHLDGWYDLFARGQLDGFRTLREAERTDPSRGPNYMVVGPWNHGDTHWLAHPELGNKLLDWYRYWLDAQPRPKWMEGPRLTYCVMLEARNGNCEWRYTDSWPVRGTGYERLYLRGDGSMSPEAPKSDEPTRSWTYNPTAGQGEAGFSKWDNGAGPPQRDADQAMEDEWKGLVYSTPPLEKGLVIAGPLVLSLEAESSPLTGVDPGLPAEQAAAAAGYGGVAQLSPAYHDTDFVVKLSDVAPDGTSTLIQSGFLRASHRALDPSRTLVEQGEVIRPWHPHLAADLDPPTPGEVRTYKIEIWPTAKRFAKGHQLRIALYSADTPNHLTLLKPAVNTVYSGPAHPSYLLLPLWGKAMPPAPMPMHRAAPSVLGVRKLPATGGSPWPAGAAMAAFALAELARRRRTRA